MENKEDLDKLQTGIQTGEDIRKTAEAKLAALKEEAAARLGVEIKKESKIIPPEAKEGTRIFLSRIPNSRFVFESGKECYFTNGWYETSDPDEIRQLDVIANKVPTIYTSEHNQETLNAIMKARKAGEAFNDISTLMNQSVLSSITKTQQTAIPTVVASSGLTEDEIRMKDESLKRAIMAQSNSR